MYHNFKYLLIPPPCNAWHHASTDRVLGSYFKRPHINPYSGLNLIMTLSYLGPGVAWMSSFQIFCPSLKIIHKHSFYLESHLDISETQITSSLFGGCETAVKIEYLDKKISTFGTWCLHSSPSQNLWQFCSSFWFPGSQEVIRFANAICILQFPFCNLHFAICKFDSFNRNFEGAVSINSFTNNWYLIFFNDCLVLLLFQNLLSLKHSKNWLDNVLVCVFSTFNGSILKQAQLKSITRTFCTRHFKMS